MPLFSEPLGHAETGPPAPLRYEASQHWAYAFSLSSNKTDTFIYYKKN